MATTPNMIAGTAYLTIDGKNYQLVGNFSYRPTQDTRETLKGMDGIHGFKGSPEAGQIKAQLRDSGAISVQDIGDASNVTVVCELANGKTVVGRNMWRTGDPLEVDTNEATFDVTWEGNDVREN
jgi:hypothetical protein